MLDGIVALDRADVPAVTQRRTLAHMVHGHQAAPAPRCQIPEWFEPLLAQARADLAAAKAHHAEHVVEHERISDAVAAAEHRLREVDAATAADRDTLADATARANRARGDLAEARHRLATAPRLQRHRVRSDVAVAERRVDHTHDYLERTRERTWAAIAGHNHAVAERNRLQADLHRHSTTEMLSASQVRGAERRVDALATWRRWATGQPLTVERLRELATTLAADRGSSQAHSRALGDTIDRWASSHDVDLHARRSDERVRSRIGPELVL